MNRLKKLNKFQKGVLAVLAGMIVLFTIIYAVLSPQKGLVFRDSFLKRTEVGMLTVYTGTAGGQTASITIYADKSITIENHGKRYGPYKVLGVDTSKEMNPEITILENGETVFRGRLKPWDDSFILFKDDGSLYTGHPIYSETTGTVLDDNGNIIDVNEPTAYEIVAIFKNADLTKRVQWGFYVFGTLLVIATALSMIFADEIFRYYMHFRIANAAEAEPSGFELASRYVAWCILPFLIILIYLLGLQVK